MKIYYSASQDGFFTKELHESLPKDKILISEKDHKEFLDKQQRGFSYSFQDGKFHYTESRDNVWDAESTSWVIDTEKLDNLLDLTLKIKLEEIDKVCLEKICLGFESSALGTVNHYGCNPITDQLNLPRAISRAERLSTKVLYMVKVGDSEFDMRLHSLPELEVVEESMDEHIESNREIARYKKQEAIRFYNDKDKSSLDGLLATNWETN